MHTLLMSIIDRSRKQPRPMLQDHDQNQDQDCRISVLSGFEDYKIGNRQVTYFTRNWYQKKVTVE